MTRTLVKTDTAGWFIDPENPDKRTRRKEGDVVMSKQEWEQRVAKATQDVNNKKAKKATRISETAGGKVLSGVLVDIKCIDCGATRTIKVQDKFQVKRCESCQKIHRRERVRENRRKRAQTK